MEDYRDPNNVYIMDFLSFENNSNSIIGRMRLTRLILILSILAVFGPLVSADISDSLPDTVSISSKTIQFDSLPEIGTVMAPKIIEKAESPFILLTSSSLAQKAFSISVDGIDYMFCINHADTVVYIDTRDTAFVTPEGVKVNMPLSEVLKRSDRKLYCETGWAHVVILPSGWRAAFTVGYTMTEHEPAPEAPVEWLFRR